MGTTKAGKPKVVKASDDSAPSRANRPQDWGRPQQPGDQAYRLRNSDLSRQEKLYSLPFTYVFNYEWRAIAERRKSLGLEGLSTSIQISGLETKSAYHVAEDVPFLGLKGIALSGGGIRSAAFCIGVTQAMDAVLVSDEENSPDAKSFYQHMDYVSSVSGGGYAGAALLNAQVGGPAFAFPSRLERNESPILRHIRDHSNYLFPRGTFSEKLQVLASYLRGIAANIPVIAVILAGMLMLTTFANEQLSNLNEPWLDLANVTDKNSFFLDAPAFLKAMFQPNSGFFGQSLLMALIIPILFLLWAIIRSVLFRPQFETRTPGTAIAALLIGILMVLFAVELQPRMVSGLHSNYCDGLVSKAVNELISNGEAKQSKKVPTVFEFEKIIANSKQRDSEIQFESIRRAERYRDQYSHALCHDMREHWELAFANHAELISSLGEKEGKMASAEFGFASVVQWIQTITVYIAAFTGFFAALRGVFGSSEGHQNQTQGILGVFANYSSMFSQIIAGLLLPLAIWLAYLYLAFWSISGATTAGLENAFSHAPAWFAAIIVSAKQGIGVMLNQIDHLSGFLKSNSEISVFYAILLLVFLGFTFLLRPNANSPHNLYRDSLARAFIVRSKSGKSIWPDPDDHRIKLSQTRTHEETPIHLFNSALNVQGSGAVNGRGRNASFFTFSDAYCGSVETGYVATVDLEAVEQEKLTLSSAMAISAAAASSAMGSQTMRPLAATFALLNVRLGYWLPNPRKIAESFHAAGQENLKRLVAVSWVRNNSLVVFIKELFGFMEEKRQLVYLSDGGHIENLGVYELLKRRCKFIIVVDAEADPQLTFSSFSAVQRYARIDLGTLIDVSTDKIKEATLAAKADWHPPVGKAAAAKATGKAIDKPSWEELKERPHTAIGTIQYPKDKDGNAQTGVMLYIKLSVTGDENDYIREYARKYRKFPHETTGDQFFSEEQFEAYRALGFHAAFKALLGRQGVQHWGDVVRLSAPVHESPEAVKKFREMFPKLIKR